MKAREDVKCELSEKKSQTKHKVNIIEIVVRSLQQQRFSKTIDTVPTLNFPFRPQKLSDSVLLVE